MADLIVYWDSCCFISLIQQENDRYAACHSFYTAAERGELTIASSTLALAEVCKVRCEKEMAAKTFPESEDSKLDNFFDNDFFRFVDVTPWIGKTARTLFRRHAALGKPNDAIHLATALYMNADVMHTYDKSDLLGLNRQIRRVDGEPLSIEVPSGAPQDLLSSAPNG